MCENQRSIVKCLYASPDLCESFVCCLGHSTLVQHVVAHIDKDLKLLLTGESVCSVTIFHDSEHLCFVGDHSND